MDEYPQGETRTYTTLKQRFVVCSFGAAHRMIANLLCKIGPNSARKEAFAKRKLWS